MPTSTSITATARITAPVESRHVYGGIYEDRLDGRVEGVLNVDLFVVVGDALVLVKFCDDMTVE
jgi:hypothetical protein